MNIFSNFTFLNFLVLNKTKNKKKIINVRIMNLKYLILLIMCYNVKKCKKKKIRYNLVEHIIFT